MNKILEKNFNLKKLLKSISVIFIYFYSSFLNLIPIYLFKLDVNNVSLKTSSYIMLFTNSIVLLVLFFIYFKDAIKEFKLFIKDFWEKFDVGFKSWLLGLGLMFVSNLFLIIVLKSRGANNENIVQEFITASPIAMGFYTCLIAPIIEEIIFRKTLKDVIKNKWLFIFLSFLFFGGAHVFGSAQNIVDYLYIIPYGAFGATFAYAYYKTNTVYTSMLFHIIHNSILFFLSMAF